MGLVSGSLANHFAGPVLGLAQGPSWWQGHLLAKMDSSTQDSGSLVVSSLQLTPPKFSWLVFTAAPCSL